MVKLTVVSSLNEFLCASNIKKEIYYSIGMSPFGPMLVATVQKFLCMLKFFSTIPSDGGKDLVENRFPDCSCTQSENVKSVIDLSKITDENVNVEILAEGTHLFGEVWRALLTIPRGETLYYSDVAKLIGKPLAIRPVASAVSKNPVGYLVPCHRVVAKSPKSFLKFAAGPEIKRLLLESEGICVEKAAVGIPALARQAVL